MDTHRPTLIIWRNDVEFSVFIGWVNTAQFWDFSVCKVYFTRLRQRRMSERSCIHHVYVNPYALHGHRGELKVYRCTVVHVFRDWCVFLMYSLPCKNNSWSYMTYLGLVILFHGLQFGLKYWSSLLGCLIWWITNLCKHRLADEFQHSFLYLGGGPPLQWIHWGRPSYSLTV